MATLQSYDLNGKKLSFANWISNLSPMDVPFTSMTGKESIQQTLFQWQTDALAKAAKNAVQEGQLATEGGMRSTLVKTNVTQILRKVVKVSDTANALANYGRGKELQYQMEKAGKEIKRDLEWAFLNNGGAVTGDATTARVTAGFHALVAGLNQKDPETDAIVHFQTAAANITEAEIFKMTMNLYLAGSDANIIMYHPTHASLFSGLQEKANTRMRIFENTPKYSVYVSTLVDPLGQEYKLIPNRWMPVTKIYFFNPSDWTQMVLRAPQRTKLAKDGSYEKWMIEMEVGLRHRNPFASGVLEVGGTTDKTHDKTNWLDGTTNTVILSSTGGAEVASEDIAASARTITGKVGDALKIKFKTSTTNVTQNSIVSVLKDGVSIWSEKATSSAMDHSANGQVLIPAITKADAGSYTLHIVKANSSDVYQSHPCVVNVKADDNDTNIQPGGRSIEALAEEVQPKARASRKAKAE